MADNKNKIKILSILLSATIGIFLITSFAPTSFVLPHFTSNTNTTVTNILSIEQASAIEVSVGNEQLSGAWEPDDVIKSNINVNMDAESITNKAENSVIKFIKMIMPILMIACVCIIMYNAIRNIFLPKERRVLMGDVVKNIFIQFFFILFAWIIVESIIFVITGSETIFFTVLFG